MHRVAGADGKAQRSLPHLASQLQVRILLGPTGLLGPSYQRVDPCSAIRPEFFVPFKHPRLQTNLSKEVTIGSEDDLERSGPAR